MNQERQRIALENLAELVKGAGGNEIRKIVEKVEAEVGAAENAIALPDGFRFFVEEDWYGFAGAMRFVDGVRPVTGKLRVKDADGREQETFVVIGAKDDDAGNATQEALVEFTTYADDEDATENQERTYVGQFPSLTAALLSFALLNEAAQPAEIGKIQAIFGFKQIN